MRRTDNQKERIRAIGLSYDQRPKSKVTVRDSDEKMVKKDERRGNNLDSLLH